MRDLEEQGLPAESPKLIDSKILRMLALGRCGMHVETARAADELLVRVQDRNRSAVEKQNYAVMAAVGYGFCAVAFSPSSKERIDYFEKAMTALRLGVAHGYNHWRWLETDADFDPLRQWPEYQRAIDDWKARAGRRK